MMSRKQTPDGYDFWCGCAFRNKSGNSPQMLLLPNESYDERNKTFWAEWKVWDVGGKGPRNPAYATGRRLARRAIATAMKMGATASHSILHALPEGLFGFSLARFRKFSVDEGIWDSQAASANVCVSGDNTAVSRPELKYGNTTPDDPHSSRRVGICSRPIMQVPKRLRGALTHSRI